MSAILSHPVEDADGASAGPGGLILGLGVRRRPGARDWRLAVYRQQVVADAAHPPVPRVGFLIDPNVVDLERLRKRGLVDAMPPRPFTADREIEQLMGVGGLAAILTDPVVLKGDQLHAVDEHDDDVISVPQATNDMKGLWQWP